MAEENKTAEPKAPEPKAPKTVLARLGKNAPVGSLWVGSVQLTTEKAAEISVDDFDRLAEDYGLVKAK